MDPLELCEGGFDNPKGSPEPCVIDRKRPIARFPDSFSANLGRKASSFFRQEDSAPGVDKIHFSLSPLPESKSVIQRKRDVIPGLPSPSPLTRNRQLSATSSVKAMVAKFEGAGNTPEKPDKMAEHDLIPSSPVVDKGKDKASFAESNDTTAASFPAAQSSQLDDKKATKDDIDLDLLKMQEFFKDEPLAHRLDDYIPPTKVDMEMKVLPLEKDGGKSIVKAAKIELWNRLVSLTDALEERYPSVKEEREAKQAVITATAAYLDEALGEPPEKRAKRETTQTSSKACRRAEKKVQKEADKKAQKAANRGNPVAKASPAASSSKAQQNHPDELSLREKYPDIFAKIDCWRSLPDPDAPAGADGKHTSGAGFNFSRLPAQPVSQPVVHQTQSTSSQHQDTLATKIGNDKTSVDDSSESDNWSTGSSNGDPFYLNKYLTPSYQAATKVFLEDFNKNNPFQPTDSQPTNKSAAESTVQPAISVATDGEESLTFIQRDPKEKGVRTALHVSDDELSDSEEVRKSKAAEAQRNSDELNKRAHERVNAAHAEGKIVHLDNAKSLRDTVETNIKKEYIVPGFGQKNKQPTFDFDEEAYAARSIASHTMKPAPLRIPSRKNQPVTGSDRKINVKGTTLTQARNPLPPGALTINTKKYRMVTGDFTALSVDVGKSSSRTASVSSTHSSRSGVNFSWPNAQRAGVKNKYEFNDEDDSDYELDEKKPNARPGQLSTGVCQSDSAPARSCKVSGSSYARGMHKDVDAFGNKSTAMHHDFMSSAASQSNGCAQKQSHTSTPPNTSAKGSSQETQRRSFTANEYQTLIQDDYEAFAKDSPEKKQKRLEDAMPTFNTGPTMRTTDATSNITHQTVVVPAHQHLPTVRLPGTTALPPTPATSQIPMTTSEKMTELDDFFSEENDHLYTTTRTDAGSSYGSNCGNGAGTSFQGHVQIQPWNDHNYHEDALSYGYAYKQTNYHTLADAMSPVPLTQDQRRQVFESYGMSEAEYPAPPDGYPNPPGPDNGSNVPPCPTRPAPVVPATFSTENSGNETGNCVGRSSADGGAPAQSLRKHRRFQRAATAPPAPAPASPAPGYDADWF
ncbi:hypothetical protein CI238_05373 [Colletotrichum incanum]|uniref:Uncharacterized protein n=1 Tax=Colletotrichum incanum TaxID=1573173 RepID=A0A167CPC8_COLIC|nr:hypothetical protein CI238_05373 [Colletotrichum incanum]OHW94934.1 hypothetical protein CSPAE12_06530 [Colletotrichum incanum]